MVYTLTVNPALDYVIHMDSLTTGEVNRTTKEDVYFGGKGINVSTVLHNLGVESIALGFIAGFTGDAIENGLKEQCVKTDFVRLSSGLTRINVKIKAHDETDINGQGPKISDEKIIELYKKIDNISDGDTLVLAGSIPNTLPSDIYEKIMERLKDKNVRFVVDATKDLLKKSLKYSPFLIKPNNFELGELVGKVLHTDAEILEAAKEMQQQGAKNVLVSMAADGALLLTEDGDVHRIGIVKGKTVNSVGAGDSMVAGFLAGYLQTSDYSYALKLGTATGGATALSEGLATKSFVDELIKQL